MAVVFGGRSSEHAISCLGAGNVLAALDRDRYEVVPVGIARDGRWVLAPDDPGQLAIEGGQLPSVEAMSAPGTEVAARLDPVTRGLVVTAPGDPPRSLGDVDVVLPLLHGAYGEDGTIQGLLEMAGARYAGAGVFASAAGMDKEYMKLIMAARGLPVGRYVVVRDRDWLCDAGDVARLAGVADLAGVAAFLGWLAWLAWASASGSWTRSPNWAGRCSSSRPAADRASGSPACWAQPTWSQRSRPRGSLTPRCWWKRR